MGFFPRFKFKRDLAVSSPKAWNQSLWNLQGQQTHSGASVSEQTALNLSAVYNAINIISSDLSSIPLVLYQKKEKTRKKALNNGLYTILHDISNPEMTAMTFRETLIAHCLSWGNGYAEKQINQLGQVTALWPIPPDRIADIKRENGTLVYYVDVNGDQVRVPRERMLHIPGLGFTGIQGYSVVAKAREAIGLGLATEDFGAKFFGAGTHPGLVASHPRTLSKEAYDNLSGELDRKYTGLGNAHRLMLLEEGMTIEKIGIPPNDAQFLETRQFQIVEIARWFNIQPMKLKDHTRSSFNNIAELMIDHVVHCLRPWAVRVEQNIGMQLLSEKERRLGYYVEHNLEGLLRGDSEARAGFYNKLWQMGSMSSNEVREKENMNPIDGGDEYYVPLNMVPMSQQEELLKAKMEPHQAPVEPMPEEEKQNLIDFFTKRSVSFGGRDRVRNAYLSVFKDAAQRIVNKETKAIKKAVNDYLTKRSKTDFRNWLDGFYKKMPDYIRTIFGPILYSYADVIQGEASKEIGVDPEMTKEIEKLVADYVKNYSGRHVSSSVSQLESILDQEFEDIAEMARSIETRADEWQEKRPEKISRNETNRESNAVAQLVFFSAGFSSVWRIRGPETCPYCKELDGRKIVSGQSYFEGNGEEFEPKGADRPMKIYGMKAHPPLHAGCDCIAIPG